jgi:hypothetical protein
MGELLVGEPAMLLNLPKFALHLLLPKENDRSRCFSFDVVICFPYFAAGYPLAREFNYLVYKS